MRRWPLFFFAWLVTDCGSFGSGDEAPPNSPPADVLCVFDAPESKLDACKLAP